MSKRNSLGPSNTLFNYFTKTPPSNKKVKPNENIVESPKGLAKAKEEVKIEVKKRERQPSPADPQNGTGSDDDVPIIPKKLKRIRLNTSDSDDSDVENKKDNKVKTPKGKQSVEKKLSESFKFEPNASPKTPKQQKAPTKENKPVEKETSRPIEVEAPAADEGNWIHCKLDWLKPDKVRDVKKRRPDHPDYEPSSLYVPPEFLKAQTPAHRQWWEMKSTHYDCVLFFKVGKFYELYHMDAAVGVNELGFSYMKGEFAHSGFPESAYGRMVSTLVSKGFKVARVEQTETPEMMQERCKRTGQTSKYDKVVRREICQVSLQGVSARGPQDTASEPAPAVHMLCVTETEANGCSTYGVCFIDTSIGTFHVGQFEDDKHSSRLLTTLAHYPPALIIYDRKTSSRTSKLLSAHCHNARREAQSLWPPEKTLKILAEKYYKTDADGDWPEGLKPLLYEGDALGLTPAPDCYLSVKALGGCVSYLTDCLLDIQILELAQFTPYSPPDVLNKTLSQGNKGEQEHKWEGGNTMVLDAITLRNLRIVQGEGCLYDKLNFCSTPMGKRLLYQWVCAPSCNLQVIKERQEAVKYLYENRELCQEAKSILTKLPDMERLLTKLHALGNLKRSLEHPDSRAIFYEEKTYSKRKVFDFISILNSFTDALKLVQMFSNVDSTLLKNIMCMSPKGKFPDYRDTLQFFKEGFDHKQAEKEGRILPGNGVDLEYDNTLNEIKLIEDELQEYLKEQEKYFKCRLTYVGTDKKRYQIEVPEKAANKAGPEYHMEGAKKGAKRFSTAETKEFLSRMQSAEEQKARVLKDLTRRLFNKFCVSKPQWDRAAQCISMLDVLLAFTDFATAQSDDLCLPDVSFGERPYINISSGRHPCIPVADFIPNDTQLGLDEATLLLLTGPNMGGKSTLMRQVALITVLAHLGSYVPAVSCSLSLCDRVFTRLGAADDILSGQSTFLVEMSETAAIVAHATSHSLVLLDELGRGTSTYDGTAIASGVCSELASRGARVIFSTHYHSLVSHLCDHPKVALAHMACMVETDESTPDNADDIPEETITFLYKLSPGACPKSYGFNAARLAGIPKDITKRAHQISRKLEAEATCVRAFRNLVKMDSAKDVREMLSALCI